jgi:hypothetical protein
MGKTRQPRRQPGTAEWFCFPGRNPAKAAGAGQQVVLAPAFDIRGWPGP